ncbi:MAG TPA: 30S ribosomal protein S7 [Nitrospiria bacterium]|nr:30S ribosomal protein S7 [Nitrospiria bacterium]
MPRRRIILKRRTSIDARYQDPLVGQMINTLMRKGKKSAAERICYQALAMASEKSGVEPLRLFKTAVENVKPVVETKSRRVGGASYQVPVEVRQTRRTSLALRWLVKFAYARSGRSMEEKLAAELLDATNRTGGAMKKREETHRMAEANKAFAHYRW